MRFDFLTLFPAMVQGPLTESILGRAQKEGLLSIHTHNIRDYSPFRHSQCDDKPYGGGAGMLLMCEPIVRCIESVIEQGKKDCGTDAMPHRIYLSARGSRLTQTKVERLAKKHAWILLLCGHYEGIDQRVIDGGWIDEEIRIGDYVLTGGELPAMVLIDALARKIPSVLGTEASVDFDSFSAAFDRKREYPHYTRPEEFRGLRVPDVLLSGHHQHIEEWREEHLG